MLMKNCRIRNVPYALNMNGMISAARLSSQPTCNINWNSGMISTTNGTMTEPKYSRKIGPRPLNLIRAKA